MDYILNYSLDELKLWMKAQGEKEFRAKQVFDWIYKGIYDFDEMTNIPEKVRSMLNDKFSLYIPEIIEVYRSKDDETIKFLMSLYDKNLIECVIMKYKHGNSICVSTQVGCRMGCKFCASTVGGMVRSLSSGEILSQVMKAQTYINERISNIVLMGSGEPLDNYDNVLKFIRSVNAEYGLNIGQRHITLSTCGLVPNIIKLAEENLQITLAISLHAPNDDLRKTMMPIANKYSINEIIDACKYYINKTDRRITFEYALVRGVNDTVECGKELIRILRGMLCHVNLIPINEVRENNLKKSSEENVKLFYNILTTNGIETTVRREMGADINAACGQLRRSYLDENETTKGV